MTNTLLIIKNILYRIVKKKSNILMHLVLPVAVVVGIFLLFSSATQSVYTAAVYDESHSKSSEYILNEIESTGKFSLMNVKEDEIEQFIVDGRASFALEIPAEFEEKIIAGEKPEIKLVALQESEGAGWMNAVLNMQVENLVDIAYGSSYDKAEYYNILENLKDSAVSLQTEKVDDSSNDVEMSGQMLGMYLMFVLLSASMTSFMMLDEKKKGTFSRIATTPVKPMSYTIANIISNLVILTFQLVLVLILIKFVIKVNFHTSLLNMFIILFFYGLCSIGFGVMVASASANINRANAIFYLYLSPSCMISGCFWPIEFMPQILQKIALVTPQRWALSAISTAQRGDSILLPILILVAFSALLFIGAAYFIKYKEKA